MIEFSISPFRGKLPVTLCMELKLNPGKISNAHQENKRIIAQARKKELGKEPSQ